MIFGDSAVLSLRFGAQMVQKAYFGAQLVWSAESEFDPASLFASGSKGVWLDPWDASTVFQDQAANTPATINTPVIRHVSTSHGTALGPELWSTDLPLNGAISSGWSYSNGVISGVSNYGAPTPTNPDIVIPGMEGFAHYRYIRRSTGAGTSLAGVPGSVPLGIFSPAGTYTAAGFLTDFRQLGANFTAGKNFNGSMEILSVRKIPGLIAHQITVTAAPVLKMHNAGVPYLYFDGVDDIMHVDFFNESWMGSLGSNCTVARAIPGVGAQILTGQSIGHRFSNTISHAGLLVINRPLTIDETAALTVHLNKKSGVA